MLLMAAALLGTTPRAHAQAVPAAPARSLWYDAGALIDERYRAGAEVASLGRFTVGLAISYSHTPHPRGTLLLPPLDGGPVTSSPAGMACAYPGCSYDYGLASRYRAWAFDLAVRYYPEALAFRNRDARLMVYGGAYAGYHWRRWDESLFYYNPPVPLATDSVVPPPQYPVAYPYALHRTIKGLEPGLEAGVRLLPAGGLFFEAGGRFTLATLDDPLQRVQQGDVEATLVLAAGLAW